MSLHTPAPRPEAPARRAEPLPETKPQPWRALAALDDGSEVLIFVGRSNVQVRGGYQASLAELLDAEERRRVRRVTLQRWRGAPDCGRWDDDSPLPLPTIRRAA